MSNKDETYNGWSNRATWHTNLVISNDQSSYQYWKERAQHYAESPSYMLAEEMERNIGRRYVPRDVEDQSVNWSEIATAWIEPEWDGEL